MERLFKVRTPADFLPIIEMIMMNENLPNPLVITLTGDLGAGKTTFTQELGKFLGITESIVSPTYTLVKQYPLEYEEYDELVHIDAYRIESEDEIGPIHLESLLNQPKTIICIEWPDMIRSIIPQTAIQIAINITDGEEREVRVSSMG